MSSGMTEMNPSFLPSIQKFYSLEAIASQPWSSDSIVYVANDGLVLLDTGNGAESLAVLILLKSLELEYEIKLAKNVADMSPSGRGPLLKCGRFTIGEFEPIVNFCHLKGYHLQSEAPDELMQNQIKSYLLLIQKSFSDVMNYFLWKKPENQVPIKQAFQKYYPWPLSSVLYLKEYYFNKKKLVSNGTWQKTGEQVLSDFIEVIESFDKKLNGCVYLIDNRLSEADILLYSYIKIINSNYQFSPMLHHLNKLTNLTDFYDNLNDIYGDHF